MSENASGLTVQAVVKGSTRITPDSSDEVRQIILQIDEPSFRFQQGQSIGVVVPGPHPFGKKQHMRRYSIVDDLGITDSGAVELSILVRRCFYIDEMNGEEYPGIASNYLCDISSGDSIILSGPFKPPFQMPPNETDNILMIGTGTGIAPFRVFIQQIYKNRGGWLGEVRLYYGAANGMDVLYQNDQDDDLANYYDQQTFQAFCGLASRPLSKDSDGLEKSIEENAQEIWDLIQQPNTYVYLAGLDDVSKAFNEKMTILAGSKESWNNLKHKLDSEGRLSELFYN